MSSLAQAEENWTTSGGLSFQNLRFSKPGSEYKQESWAATGLAYRPLGDWFVGGNVAYNSAKVDMVGMIGRYRPDTTTVGAFSMRNLGTGLFADFSLNYGNSILDSSRVSGVTVVDYSNTTKFLTAAAGLSQFIPLSNQLGAIVNTRYTLISSRAGAYTDSTGAQTAALHRHWGYLTVGGALAWQIDQLRPSIKTEWHRANAEFVAGTNDHDYFSINLGIAKQIRPQTSLSASYGATAGKAYVRERTLSVNLTHQF